MTKSFFSPTIDFFKEQQFFSIAILRLVGYGLIAMALIDYASLLIPPQLMNPVWEFQTVGGIIERIPIMLLGMVFIFWGERSDRTPIETFLLKYSSWLCLIFAIFLLLTLPLNIVNGFRIYYYNNAKINQQIESRVEVLNNFQNELEKAQSLEQTIQLLQKQSQRKIKLSQSVDPEKLKNDILKSLAENQNSIKSQADNLRNNQRVDLLKQGLKWNLGSLIAAFIFLFIWQNTLWARIKYEIDNE